MAEQQDRKSEPCTHPVVLRHPGNEGTDILFCIIDGDIVQDEAGRTVLNQWTIKRHWEQARK